MNKPRNTSKAIRTKSSIAILITAAVLMLLISGIQQYYSRNQTRADLERNAEMEMVIKANDINHSLEATARMCLSSGVW